MFNKSAIPDNQDELTEFCAKIAKYGLSLEQYKSSLTTDRYIPHVHVHFILYILFYRICTPTKRARNDDE